LNVQKNRARKTDAETELAEDERGRGDEEEENTPYDVANDEG
jgi:hypothetical protein